MNITEHKSARRAVVAESLEIALLRAAIETGTTPAAHEVPLLMSEAVERLKKIHFKSAELFHESAFDVFVNLLGGDGELG